MRMKEYWLWLHKGVETKKTKINPLVSLGTKKGIGSNKNKDFEKKPQRSHGFKKDNKKPVESSDV